MMITVVGIGADGMAGLLREQPVEAVEVVLQSALGIFVGVIEDANRPAPAAVANDGEKFWVEFALSERDNLLIQPFAIAHRAVEVQRDEIRLHLREQLAKARHVLVTVMLVIDDADVGHAAGAQLLDDGDLILRLAEPAAVIVEGDAAIDSRRGVCDGAEAFHLGGNACSLFIGRLGRIAAAGHPKLHLTQIVPL